MARSARQDRAGAVHWVRAEGRESGAPLEGLIDEAKLAFQAAAKRAGWVILDWVIDQQGYELLIKSTRANLSDSMQALQRDLVRRRKVFFPERRGAMFRGRFLSTIVESDDRLSQLHAAFRARRGGGEANSLMVPSVAQVGDSQAASAEWQEAEVLISFALDWYGIEEAALLGLRKSAELKCLIAAFVRSSCSISVGWIAERLNMGHPSAASRGILRASEGDNQLKLDLARLQLAHEISEATP